MNPDTGRFEPLAAATAEQVKELEKRYAGLYAAAAGETVLVRPDGSPVPPHWAVYAQGDLVVINAHTFKVVYINECTLVLEPVRPETALPAKG